MNREDTAKSVLGEHPGVHLISHERACSAHPWAVAAMEADDVKEAERNATQILNAILLRAPNWENWFIEYPKLMPVDERAQ
jgi:hypothetical protein